MSFQTVVITWDESDAALTPVGGSVTFQLSAPLIDSTGAVAEPQPLAYYFTGGSGQSDPLVANDSAGATPAGTAYEVTVQAGDDPPRCFTVQVLIANGDTQTLGSLEANAAVPAEEYARYLQLPAAAPTSDSQVLGLSATSPLVTEWVDALAPDGDGSALTGITASQVGADPSGSSSAAQAAAESYADGVAATAQSNAEAYADSAAGTSQANAEAASLPLSGGTVTGDLDVEGDLGVVNGGQLVANDGSAAKMRLGQKSNGEIVWSYNVNQNDSDALDDPTDSAFKFSMQGTGGDGYDGLHLQHIAAGTGTWTDAPTLFQLNGDGTLTIGPYALPAADGAPGQFLQTDGNGNVSWATP